MTSCQKRLCVRRDRSPAATYHTRHNPGSGRKVLFLTGDHNDLLYRSARNIPRTEVLRATDASTLDLMNAQVVVLQEGAVEGLTAEAVADAHRKDMEIQEEYGVTYHKYWYNDETGEVLDSAAEQVRRGFAGRVPVLDGGPCRAGVESTILAVDGDEVVQLRAGALARETVAKAIGRPVAIAASDAAIAAPGMLSSHYAPTAKLRLDAVAPEEPPDPECRTGSCHRRRPDQQCTAGHAEHQASCDGEDVLREHQQGGHHMSGEETHRCPRARAFERGRDVLRGGSPEEEPQEQAAGQQNTERGEPPPDRGWGLVGGLLPAAIGHVAHSMFA
jgi:hypothetical protein